MGNPYQIEDWRGEDYFAPRASRRVVYRCPDCDGDPSGCVACDGFGVDREGQADARRAHERHEAEAEIAAAVAEDDAATVRAEQEAQHVA